VVKRFPLEEKPSPKKEENKSPEKILKAKPSPKEEQKKHPLQ